MAEQFESSGKPITSESLRQEGYTLLEDLTNPTDRVGIRIRNMDNGVEGKVLAYGSADEVGLKEVREDDFSNYYKITWDNGHESIFQEATTDTDHIVVAGKQEKSV